MRSRPATTEQPAGLGHSDRAEDDEHEPEHGDELHRVDARHGVYPPVLSKLRRATRIAMVLPHASFIVRGEC